jgi:hypothetical protein
VILLENLPLKFRCGVLSAWSVAGKELAQYGHPANPHLKIEIWGTRFVAGAGFYFFHEAL